MSLEPRHLKIAVLAVPVWLLLIAGPAAAQELRVVAVGSAPFVMETGSAISGLSVDVWSAAADSLGVQARIETVDDVPGALGMVAGGRADVAIGPISITADRARQVRFTQPYFNSSLGILAPPSGSMLDRFRPFLTQTFIRGAIALAGILLLVGTLFWLAERNPNPAHFPRERVAGIGNGLWMALVTMTTVGYGDRVPVSAAGRVVAGVWMVVSLVIASSLTAFLATALTLSQIEVPAIASADELRGRPVGVVRGSTSEDFVAQYGGRAVPADDIDQAIAALASGDTAAVVFDRPVLRYALSQEPNLPLELSPVSYQPQNYGFAVGAGSELGRDLDLALLELQESGRLREVEERWLGSQP